MLIQLNARNRSTPKTVVRAYSNPRYFMISGVFLYALGFRRSQKNGRRAARTANQTTRKATTAVADTTRSRTSSKPRRAMYVCMYRPGHAHIPPTNINRRAAVQCSAVPATQQKHQIQHQEHKGETKNNQHTAKTWWYLVYDATFKTKTARLAVSLWGCWGVT